MISEAMEDYLKALYTLGHEGPGGPVSTGALAATLGVAAPSVSGMLKKLAATGLVERHPRRGARLTPAGEQVALQVLRHHRLLSTSPLVRHAFLVSCGGIARQTSPREMPDLWRHA